MKPVLNHHKRIDKWKLFEEDCDHWQKNREKYKGISPRPEDYTFYYRWEKEHG